MKVLCVCYSGSIRSVALKHILCKIGHDALACGIDSNTIQTIRLLVGWADIVVVMKEEFAEKVRVLTDRKDKRLLIYDVGEDRWNHPFHPELEETLLTMVAERRDFIPA